MNLPENRQTGACQVPDGGIVMNGKEPVKRLVRKDRSAGRFLIGYQRLSCWNFADSFLENFSQFLRIFRLPSTLK